VLGEKVAEAFDLDDGRDGVALYDGFDEEPVTRNIGSKFRDDVVDGGPDRGQIGLPDSGEDGVAHHYGRVRRVEHDNRLGIVRPADYF